MREILRQARGATSRAEKAIESYLNPVVAIAEKVLMQVAPGIALGRCQNRVKAMAVGAYVTPRERRAGDYSAPSGDFNTDVLPELDELRRESEDLYRKNMLAAAAINRDVTSVIGPGLTAHPRIDAKFLGLTKEQADEWEETAARRYRLWSESKYCTVNRKHNFRKFCNLVYLSAAIRGDSFILTPEEDPEPSFPFRLRLQLVEADRVCNENDEDDTDTLSGGISTYPNGRLNQAHIRTTHPGSDSSEAKWEKRDFFGKETGRRNVLHFHKSIRGDQSRGVPDLAPVIESLKGLGVLTQASIDAGVIQTLLSVFVKTAEGDGINIPEGGSNTTSSPSIKLGQASVTDLALDESIEVVNPTQPNNGYAAFVAEFSTQFGAAMSIPREVLLGHFQSSYSAAQAALLEAWRYYMMRRGDAVDDICQPVYELFIAGEVAAGVLPAFGFFTDPEIRAAYCGADWVGAPRGHIKEGEQNRADSIAVNRGWKTDQQCTQERGNRRDRVMRQRETEIKQREEAGLLTKGEDLVDKPEEKVVIDDN